MNRLLVIPLIVALLVPMFGIAEANPGAPDLQVANVSVTVPSPAQPNKVHVEVTVANRGDAPTGAFVIRWYPHQASNEIGCSIEAHGLNANKQGKAKCNYTYVDSGEMHWRAVVDEEAEVVESNESNNTQTGVISIGGSAAKPDLLIEEAYFEPVHPVPDQPFKAVMTVHNNSSVDVTQPFRGLWEFDGAVGVEDCKWTFGNGLRAGAKATAKCERTSHANPAQYDTQPTVDADNIIAERDEVNNDKPTTLILYATDAPDPHTATRPDLIIKNLRTTPTAVVPGQKIHVFFDVVNQGTAAPASKVLWHSGANDQDAIVANVKALEPGAVHHIEIVDFTAPSTPGSYSHYAMADSASLIDEENENNNRLAAAENLVVMAEDHPDIEGPADLVIKNLKMSPNPVTHGHDFQVEFEVVNQGQGPAKKSVAEWRTPPGGGLSFRCDVPKLEKGASHRCTWQFLSAPAKKNYGTTARADLDNAVSESNEDNNSLKVTLEVK